MKSVLFFLVAILWVSIYATAQVGINTDNSQPNSAAMLDIKSTTKGFLLPRMTSSQRGLIVSPPEGLMVFCTNCGEGSTGVLSIFSNGKWGNYALYAPCIDNPTAGSHVPSLDHIIWEWDSVAGATGYKWSNTNNSATAEDMGVNTSKTEYGLACNTSYTRYVWAYSSCGFSPTTTLTQATTAIPDPPEADTHIPSRTQIVWKWETVSGATGYKWSTSNNYTNATDMGTATTKTVTGLTCGTQYTSYVWAYCSCGNSSSKTLTQRTSLCAITCGTDLTDARDGKIYPTILISTQCWLKKNMNVGTRINISVNQTDNGTIEKYCSDDLVTNCDVYGGQYQWAEVVQYLNGATNTSTWNPVPNGNIQGICPEGWHIPTEAEWTTLTNFLGGVSVAGGKMKETGTTHWNSPNTGANNSSGFTALPGGDRYPSTPPRSDNLKYYDYNWSSTESPPTGAIVRRLDFDSIIVTADSNAKTWGLSVRCIND